MRKAGHMPARGPFRTLSLGVLMAVLGLFLASCSAGSLLTDSGGVATEPKGKTVPPVAIGMVKGIPPGKLAELKAALGAAGGLHDIGFVEGNFESGVFGLTGDFRATSGSAGVRLLYQWQFRDGDGVLIDNIDGEENAGVYAGADPWGGVSAAALDRIARRTAEQMARKLSQMGYATRLSSLTAPPAELFAQAAPDAHREIDFDTLHGPGMGEAGAAMMAAAAQAVDTNEEIEPAVAAVAPLKGEGLMPRVEVSDTPSAAPPPDEPGMEVVAVEHQPASRAEAPAAAPKPAKKGERQIRAVAVLPVKGSPGAGDAELTAAMRKTLSAAGWPVVSKPQPDALTVVGRVKVAPKGDGQSVSLRWEVKSPDGKTLGEVKQANDVPRGALDQGWGPAAIAVAEAAATGIFDIVKQYR